MSSFYVPDNQTVCWTIYWQSAVRESGLTSERANRFMKWVEKDIDAGIPIWAAALTLKSVSDCVGDYRKEKTPLQLAKRVVRL